MINTSSSMPIETGHPVDIAATLDLLSARQAGEKLIAIPLRQRAAVFGYMSLHKQVALSRILDRADLAEIVTAMSADDRADLFNYLPQGEQEHLLRDLAQEEREDIRRLAAYADGTAGAMMTSDYATLPANLTVSEAIELLRREAPDKETIYRAYILDDERKLIGSVPLKALILAAEDTLISDIMEKSPIRARLEDKREKVAQKIARYDLLALPVVDSERRLVGIVTHDDAADAMQQENTQDFHKIGTVGSLTQSVRDASIRVLFTKRIGWLALLIFGNLFSGAGIAAFEDMILAYVALVFFLPLLIDSSGNAGSQSSTLMVRALATGDVEMKDWGKLIVREVAVAILLGAAMALIVFPIGFARGGYEIALTVGLTMIAVVFVGCLIGMSLPFILSRFNLDPATASAPLVTTISDAAGVIVYFSIATMVMGM